MGIYPMTREPDMSGSRRAPNCVRRCRFRPPCDAPVLLPLGMVFIAISLKVESSHGRACESRSPALARTPAPRIGAGFVSLSVHAPRKASCSGVTCTRAVQVEIRVSLTGCLGRWFATSRPSRLVRTYRDRYSTPKRISRSRWSTTLQSRPCDPFARDWKHARRGSWWTMTIPVAICSARSGSRLSRNYLHAVA
jgi:hypothetical protein